MPPQHPKLHIPPNQPLTAPLPPPLRQSLYTALLSTPVPTIPHVSSALTAACTAEDWEAKVREQVMALLRVSASEFEREEKEDGLKEVWKGGGGGRGNGKREKSEKRRRGVGSRGEIEGRMPLREVERRVVAGGVGVGVGVGENDNDGDDVDDDGLGIRVGDVKVPEKGVREAIGIVRRALEEIVSFDTGGEGGVGWVGERPVWREWRD